MQIDRILFPTDFSEGSKITAQYAADLATKYAARVYIMHIIYDVARDSGLYGSRLNFESIYDDVRKSAQAELDRRVEKSFKDIAQVETVLKVGVPFEDIITFSQEADIDLIVIGSHGRKGIDRVLFGSTVQRVLRRAKCAVLTVREQQ